MITVQYTINKEKVLEEVARTSSYVGKTAVADGSAYEQVFTTDADRDLLDRYWREACGVVAEMLKPVVNSVWHGPDYVVIVRLPSAYNQEFTGIINSDLFSFVVNTILSKWFMMTAKEEAATYATLAEGALNDAKAKVYFKKKPTRD